MNPEVFTLQFLGMVLLYSLLGLLILAAGGAPLLALIGERLALSRKRVFLDKMGGQLAAMSGILALCTIPFSLGVWLMGWAGGWVTLYLKQPDMPLPEFSLELAGPVNLLGAGLYLLALVLVVLYWLTWKSMRKSREMHSRAGLLAVAACFSALIFNTVLKYVVFFREGILISDLDFRAFLGMLAEIQPGEPLLPTIALAVALCVAAGAGSGLVYLLLRRNKEDYGRDYYTFALRTLASWAIVACCLCVFAGGWLAASILPGMFSPAGLQRLALQPRFLFPAAGLLCFVLACLSWGVIERSNTPLRHKPAVVLGACFLWFGLHFQGLGIYLNSIS